MRSKSVSDNKHSSETATEGFASTCSVLVMGLFALTFVFQNFVIPSSSMASTLLVGRSCGGRTRDTSAGP
jgi:signal peptidase I